MPLKRHTNRQPINVTSADVPGPQFPVYLAGAQLLEVFPVLPLLANVSSPSAMSYAGQFNIMAIADKDTYPDLGVFRRQRHRQLRALAAPGSPVRVGAPVWGGVRAGQTRPGRLHQRGPAYCPIGTTDGPAVRVIRLYPPDPARTSVILGAERPRR